MAAGFPAVTITYYRFHFIQLMEQLIHPVKAHTAV